MASSFVTCTPLIPSGPSLEEAISFYVDRLGFTVTWRSDTMAGLARDGVSFNLVQNDERRWADNSSFSIGVSDLDVLYREYAGVPANVGPLETKPWGRREFHMIVPSGVCLQFYQTEAGKDEG